MVNINIQIKPSKTLNCKSRNVIYLWQCLLCDQDDSYFGRTIQKSHERTNIHRRCFTEETKWEDPALSIHDKNVHPNHMDLSSFRITLVKITQTDEKRERKRREKREERERGERERRRERRAREKKTFLAEIEH